MSDSFTDERGTIQDLLSGPIDAVTQIFTREAAVRGNHSHARTTQWTYVVAGRLRVVTRNSGGMLVTRQFGAGDMFCDQPGVEHAWQAVTDTTVLVFTRGPRSGENYEDDVTRLTGADRLIR